MHRLNLTVMIRSLTAGVLARDGHSVWAVALPGSLMLLSVVVQHDTPQGGHDRCPVCKRKRPEGVRMDDAVRQARLNAACPEDGP